MVCGRSAVARGPTLHGRRSFGLKFLRLGSQPSSYVNLDMHSFFSFINLWMI